MSFSGEPFAFDVFVTYSHGPVDRAGVGLLRPWSEAFVRALERELQYEADPGQEVRVFFDQKDRPGDGVDPLAPLSEQLQQKIEGSALLTVIMSPHYLASQWCRDEREWWVEAQRRQNLPLDRRIAVVRITPTSEPWPAELLDADGKEPVGFDFIDYSQQAARPRPFGWMGNPVSETLFNKGVVRLAGDLRTHLEYFVTILQTRAVEKDEERPVRPVYLHGRQTDEEVWRRKQADLVTEGFAVLPFEPEPVEHRSIQATFETSDSRVAAMAGCDALLLLGTSDLDALAADMVAVGLHARRAAVARLRLRKMPCAVLDVAGLATVRPDIVRTAEQLRIGWIDASAESWAGAARRWLAAATGRTSPAPAAP